MKNPGFTIRPWVRRLFGAMLLLLPALALAQPRFSATLDPATIVLGESATLSLHFEGGEPEAVPEIPPVDGVRIDYTGQSQSFFSNGASFVNRLDLQYNLTPTRAGAFIIPAIRVKVGNVTLSDQPVRLTVTASNRTPGTNQLAFVRVVTPKNQVYLGEVFQAEVRLYTAVRIANTQLQPLAAQGFTFGKNVRLADTQTRVGDVVYTVLGFATAATATKVATLDLGPVECSTILLIPASRRQRQVDPFQDLFGDAFGPRAEQRQVTMSSDSQKIQVLPLPREGQPRDFSGAVGQFNFTVTVSPTNVAVGDPVTLKVLVSGKGAFDNVTLPSLQNWKQFQTYPATSHIETTDPLGIEGTKTFEQVVVPQNIEVKEVPALAFSYFDPEQKTYRTLTQPVTPIVVRPSGSVQSLALNPNPAAPAGASSEDLVALKPRLGALASISGPWIRQPWFLALQCLPVAGWLAALGWRKRRDHLANNPRLVRRQRVIRETRSGLGELARLAAANQSPEFFALLFHLLQEQLGERLDLPAAAITEVVIDEQLIPQGAPQETAESLRELFQACNQARYARVSSSQELLSLVPKVEAALKQLQQLELPG